MGRGSLVEPALLASLASQAAHGYDLMRAIETVTQGFLSVDSGGVYRALRRLEEEGLVESSWASGEFGPQRREYRLTPDGSALLEQWVVHLRQRRDAIGSLLDAIEQAGVAAGTEENEKDDSDATDERREK
jgi:DNA-binding PadR family transcriptional regulator